MNNKYIHIYKNIYWIINSLFIYKVKYAYVTYGMCLYIYIPIYVYVHIYIYKVKYTYVTYVTYVPYGMCLYIYIYIVYLELRI